MHILDLHSYECIGQNGEKNSSLFTTGSSADLQSADMYKHMPEMDLA